MYKSNKSKLTNGMETDINGMTFSYDTEVGVFSSVGISTRSESTDLGTPPTYVTSINFSFLERYTGGLSFSTTEINNPYGLYISYSLAPNDATDDSVTYTTDNSYYLDYIPSTTNLVGFNNGGTTFSVSANDRDALIYQSQAYTTVNLRDHNNLVYENRTLPVEITSLSMTYSLFHNMYLDNGTYDNGYGSYQWIPGNFGFPVPSQTYVYGLMDLGLLDQVNSRISASYSNSTILDSAVHTDQWFHISLKSINPSGGLIETGCGYVTIKQYGATLSLTNEYSSSLEFSMGEYGDIKYDPYVDQFINIDVLMGIPDNELRLVVNGKLTVVNNGTYDPTGNWSFSFGTPSITEPYLSNYDLSGTYVNCKAIVDDIWYLSLTSGGYTFAVDDLVTTTIRGYLDKKYGV